MSNCTSCGAALTPCPTWGMGDPSSGICVGIGIVLCPVCYDEDRERFKRSIAAREKADPMITLFGVRMRQSELDDIDEREY